MDFTGERFVPGLGGNIELEHEHRYRFCLDIVEGGRVLDIASGEGFGSAMMAERAAFVWGVDIDAQAVAHATKTYRAENLRFLPGSCTAIPLPDASVDVVVSFETIEHHDAHDEMMKEIRRVLRPGGAVVISSPDKRTYSDERAFHNAFHVKELYAEEFAALLQGNFAHVAIFAQRIVYGSAILRQDGSGEIRSYSVGSKDQAPGLKDPIYQIAVASDDQSWVVRGRSGLLEETVFRSEALTERTKAYEEQADAFRLRIEELEYIESTGRGDVARLSASETALRVQSEALSRDVARLTRLYFSGTVWKRLAFHRSGVPRGWLRKLMLHDTLGNPRPLTRRILFKKSGRIRPIFEAWYAPYLAKPENKTRVDYTDFLRIHQESGALGRAATLHIVTSQHTEFIGQIVAAALAQTRLKVTLGTKMPRKFDHDLYIVVSPQMFDRLPPADKTIMFQVEQVRASTWVDSSYLDRLRQSLAILDYSRDNIAALIDHGLPYKQIYYMPILPLQIASASNTERDIDVLFYGAIGSLRRGRYINALSERLNLRVESNLFGAELRNILDRTKVVVNVHFYENALLETTRISEALSHGAYVVSEEATDQSDRDEFDGLVDFVPRDDVDSFVMRVEEALGEWTGSVELPRYDDFSGTRYHILRALHGCGVLSFEELQEACRGLKLPSSRLVLALPEQKARYEFARKNQLAGTTFFPGLREIDGWKGCALSYKFMAGQALAQQMPKLMIYEEDASFAPESAERLAVVERYLSTQAAGWDVFSGLLTDLNSDTQVLQLDTFETEEFIHIDTVIGMVFAIYNESALRIIAEFKLIGNDTARHTIDRYLKSKCLRCVTVLPPIANHSEDHNSTLWNTENNDEIIGVIRRSIETLQAKKMRFVPSLGDADCGGNSTP